MRIKVLFSSIILVLICCILPVRAGVAVPSLKEWRSDPNYISLLSDEQALGPFAIRLPAGFQLTGTKKAQTFVVNKWYGPDRGGVHAFLLVSMGVDDNLAAPGSPAYYTGAKKLFSRLRNSYGKTYVKYIQAGMQQGRVNGMVAERAYFKGRVMAGEEPLDAHGMYYLVDTGRYTALVMAADTEPFTKTTLPMLEAACLTIRPVDSEAAPPSQ